MCLKNSIHVDVDFVENLSIPVKFEPQLIHWCHHQVSIHFGITKSNGEKLYHPYFSDDKVNDTVFSDNALKEMLAATDTEDLDTLIIESVNCTNQFKSAAHFYNLQYVMIYKSQW